MLLQDVWEDSLLAVGEMLFWNIFGFWTFKSAPMQWAICRGSRWYLFKAFVTATLQNLNFRIIRNGTRPGITMCISRQFLQNSCRANHFRTLSFFENNFVSERIVGSGMLIEKIASVASALVPVVSFMFRLLSGIWCRRLWFAKPSSEHYRLHGVDTPCFLYKVSRYSEMKHSAGAVLFHWPVSGRFHLKFLIWAELYHKADLCSSSVIEKNVSELDQFWSALRTI